MMATTAYIDDSCSEVIDPPKTEVLDVVELPGDHTQHPPKPNVVVSSSVRELLECPVCLSAMYPPIHQVHIHMDPSHVYIYSCINKFTCSNVVDWMTIMGYWFKSSPLSIMNCYHHFSLTFNL